MWNFFSRESFPYEIGEKYIDYLDYSVFAVHKGVKKNSGEKVSIFSYNVKSGNKASLEIAKNTIKKLKTLKHPSILTYIDSYEDENVIHLVTDQVVPLLAYLDGIKGLETSELYLKWGLSTICEAVKFLNEHNQRHNNIFHGAVFVDDSGSWRLGEIGYLSSETAPYPQKVLSTLNKYSPPDKDSSPHLSDYWGLGVLIWEVFNGELQSSDSILQPKKVPKSLLTPFKELTRSNKSKSECIIYLIKGCTENNMLFTTLDFLQNYHLKDKDVKSKVCKDLLLLLPSIPKNLLLNKVVKLLKQAYDFDSDNSVFLVPVVSKIPSIISEEEFQASVEQFVMTLFSSNDRATRLALLINIEQIINKVNSKSINALFPTISTGFLDSNPKIRGETVKAVVHIAPKLSKRYLNDDALRHLLLIQSKDPEAYIRTNCTICLGKIAHCLQPETRKKVLIPAFLQALRDPYPAVRNAGVQAFAVTHRFFPLDMIARNALPGLVCLTVDVDINVRQNSFKTIKVLFTKLEKYSESPELKEELEKDVMSQTVENSSSWSSWAFAAITSKLLKPTDSKLKPSDQEISENKQSDEEAMSKQPSVSATNTDFSKCFRTNEDEKSDVHKSDDNSDGDKSDWDDDGWGDAFEEVLESPMSLPKTRDVVPSKRKPEPSVKKKNPPGPLKLGTRININEI